ncbi:hypothetical protein SJDPG4_02125 [Porphyromonas gingivalis SJD4]|nr:hypothetical protein SJDPG4_02125 [Porphyromonas gingivalis SJD4]
MNKVNKNHSAFSARQTQPRNTPDRNPLLIEEASKTS